MIAESYWQAIMPAAGKKEIEKDVIRDIESRDDFGIAKLEQFYFNILNEQDIKSSSFRYKHAFISLMIIRDYIGDKQGLEELKEFNDAKRKNDVTFGIHLKNPVKGKVSNKAATAKTIQASFGFNKSSDGAS